MSLNYASIAILVHLDVLSVTHIKYRSRGTRAYYPISTISVIVGRGFVSGNDGHVSRDLSSTGLSMCWVLMKGEGRWWWRHCRRSRMWQIVSPQEGWALDTSLYAYICFPANTLYNSYRFIGGSFVAYQSIASPHRGQTIRGEWNGEKREGKFTFQVEIVRIMYRMSPRSWYKRWRL